MGDEGWFGEAIQNTVGQIKWVTCILRTFGHWVSTSLYEYWGMSEDDALLYGPTYLLGTFQFHDGGWRLISLRHRDFPMKTL